MSKPKPFKPCKGCSNKKLCTLEKKCKDKKKSKPGSRKIYGY